MTTLHTNFDVPTLNELVDANHGLNPSEGVLAEQGEWLVFFSTNSMMETAYDRANEKVLDEILEDKDGWDSLTLMTRGTGYTTLYLVDPNGEAFKDAIESHCALAEYPLLRDDSVSDCEHCGECFASEVDKDHFPYCGASCDHEANDEDEDEDETID